MEEAMTERVMGVLGRIRPMLNMDGGDVELVEVRNQEVYLRLKGLFLYRRFSRPTQHQPPREPFNKRLRTSTSTRNSWRETGPLLSDSSSEDEGVEEGEEE